MKYFKVIINKLKLIFLDISIWAPEEYVGHIKFVKYLQEHNIKLDTILDIGANSGNWSKYLKLNGLKHSKFYLVEPNDSYFKSLAKIGIVLPHVLSDSVKTVKFFQINGTGDSYFKEISNLYSHVIPKEVNTQTLDSLNLPKFDLIKIDTQGSELDVLKGYKLGLHSSSAIILEIPVSECNVGAPNFTEYIDFMKQRNFLPAQVIEQHIADGELKQVDIGFIREDLIIQNKSFPN